MRWKVVSVRGSVFPRLASLVYQRGIKLCMGARKPRSEWETLGTWDYLLVI